MSFLTDKLEVISQSRSSFFPAGGEKLPSHSSEEESAEWTGMFARCVGSESET